MEKPENYRKKIVDVTSGRERIEQSHWIITMDIIQHTKITKWVENFQKHKFFKEICKGDFERTNQK